MSTSLFTPARVVHAAEKYVKKILHRESSGHDWWHIVRVRRMALRIAREEKVDTFVVEMAALLHDIADRKIVGTGNEKQVLATIEHWLTKQHVPNSAIEEIMYAITHQSFLSSGLRPRRLKSKPAQVVQDADRLDALGAIGIARCFVYNGKRGSIIHDPAIKPRQKLSVREYLKDNDTAINHFYEKLLKLKGLMNTRTGKRLATHRHRFMETYLAEFYREWDGEK